MASLLLVIAGCSAPVNTSTDEDPAAYREQVAALQARLEEAPNDVGALRALGTIYVRTGRSEQATDPLATAYNLRPDDPQILFFYGLASERTGREERALDLYRQFGDVPEDSRYRTPMEARYSVLLRRIAEREARQRVADEEAVTDQPVSERAVAVLPLTYRGGDERFAPLGRGLAEMVITDLAQIDRLQLVERVRLQAILDELALGQSEAVDPSTAPRVGRLVGAGQIVGGSYLVTRDDRVRLDLSLIRVDTGTPQVETRSGRLDDLFDLQTALVFQIVDALGLDLTPQERDAIEPVPTRNLQAFLAYSRGLLDEDRGRFGSAATEYRQAQTLDPSFQAAKSRLDRVQSVRAATGRGTALRTARANRRAARSLVRNRLQRMTGFSGLPRVDRNINEQTTRNEELLPLPPAPPSSPAPSDGQ